MPKQFACITLTLDINGEEKDVSFNISIQTSPPAKEEQNDNNQNQSHETVSTTGEIDFLTAIQIADAAGDVLERLDVGGQRNLLEYKKKNRNQYSKVPVSKVFQFLFFQFTI